MMRVIINIVLLTILIFQLSCYTFPYQTLNHNPMIQLEENYSVYLDSTWTHKQAHALLKVFESIPPDLKLHFSRWNISNDDLENGIKIESKDTLKYVTISRSILPVGDSQEVEDSQEVKGFQEVEGSQKIWSQDKYLYYAVLQFITENGTSRSAIKLILQERYGISIDIPSYGLLTKGVTNRTAEDYSDFSNQELMLIISILEEFPQTLRKTPQLKYIVRRIDNDEDEDTRGISTAVIGRGYIDFAGSIFRSYGFNNTRRIIAHEKTHFLWAYAFNYQLKQDWIKLAGWYRDPESESGWSTTKDRSEFVSDYAYEENPNEDMAESVANYLVSPDRLRSCSLEKYEFIHKRVILMYGKSFAPSTMM